MTATTAKPIRRLIRAEEPEWLVWALVIGMLLIGLVIRTIIETRTVHITEGNVSVTYPAEWVNVPPEHEFEVVQRSEPLVSSLFPATVRISQMPVSKVSTNADSLDDLALKWSDRLANDLPSFRVLSIEPAKVNDQDAAQINYAYVAEPLLGGPSALPIVARGQEVLVSQADVLTVVSFVADADAYDGLAATWQRILGSVELK